MSGSAALSAARKRRASTAPSGGAIAVGPAPTGYYGRGAGPGPGPKEATNFIQQPNNGNAGALPPQPMNIYENIELIKHQLTERTKLIQTQGSSMPAEKVRVLQKQNEIQMQILKQKMAIAAQMENDNQSRGPPAHVQEPEFLYEKGVPRKNPNYRDPNDVGRVAHAPVSAPAPIHASKQRGSSANTHTTQLSPFVSMLSDTGVIPPPVVVLKAHDIKLQEHNDILHDIVHELDDLRASMMAGGGPSVVQTHSSGGLSMIKEESRNISIERSGADENAEEDEAEPEELLMEVVMNDLTNSREFVEGIVNKIVNETNLSEVIMKIEPLVKENQELRSLIHSQQQMMNEMNTMLLRLLNGGGGGGGASAGDSNTPDRETVVDGDGLFPSCEMTEIILSGTNDHVESSDVNAEAADAGVEADEEPEEAAEADEEPDAEAAADAEEAEEAEAAEDADEADDAEAEADETEEADETHESDETRTLETTDYTYDEYDKRNFIEPILLVVSEL